MGSLTQQQALVLFNSGWWRGLEPRQVVGFQLFENRLCMPFGEFHEAVEKVLGHSVWTHQFGAVGVEMLRREFLGEAPAPTFAQILELIPADKRVLVVTP